MLLEKCRSGTVILCEVRNLTNSCCDVILNTPRQLSKKKNNNKEATVGDKNGVVFHSLLFIVP